MAGFASEPYQGHNTPAFYTPVEMTIVNKYAVLLVALLLSVIFFIPVNAAPQKIESKKYAVLIGLNDNQQGLKLKMGDDAKRLNEALLMAGWDRKNIKTLFGSRAKMENIYEAFDWLREVEDVDSTIVIYIGGHGNQSGIRIYDTFFNYNMMNDCFDGWESQKQFIAVNCCYSGGILPHIEGENRIVMSSSSDRSVPLSHQRKMSDWGKCFIEYGLKQDKSIQDSFCEGRMIDNYGSPFYL